ncbi:hypothetical protein D3C80_657040 [compost metagenome]
MPEKSPWNRLQPGQLAPPRTRLICEAFWATAGRAVAATSEATSAIARRFMRGLRGFAPV